MLVYNNSLNTLETGILCELTVSPRPDKAPCFSAANPSAPPPPPLGTCNAQEKYTFLAGMFCFPKSDHVMLSREFAFCFPTNYACTCMWMQVYKTTFERNSSLGYHHVICKGKQNIQTKKV